MRKEDIIESIATQIMVELRYEVTVYGDFDNNTEYWLERGREIARNWYENYGWVMEEKDD